MYSEDMTDNKTTIIKSISLGMLKDYLADTSISEPDKIFNLTCEHD